ncbi:MAG: hypothetical protein HYV34_02950 [Candidatus Kerfeldbacteria bacterium]|nr:hypothetical protein [Candidatus Kerfeldbacteria bacterium]
MRVSKTQEQPLVMSVSPPKSRIGFHPFRWMHQAFRALIFLVFFGILSVALWFVAASGLFTIPILSDLVYKAPVPTRRVVASENDSSTIAERFTIGFNGVDLKFTEAELTRRLQSEDDTVSQVVLVPEGMEYLRVFGPDDRFVLLFEATINAADGIQFDVTSMKLGAVSIPRFLQKSIATSVLAQTFGTEILLASTVKDVELRDGEIQFIIK